MKRICIIKCYSDSITFHPHPHYNLIAIKGSLLKGFSRRERLDIVSRILDLGIFPPSSRARPLTWKKKTKKQKKNVQLILIGHWSRLFRNHCSSSIPKSSQVKRQLTGRFLCFVLSLFLIGSLWLNYRCVLCHRFVFFTWFFFF